MKTSDRLENILLEWKDAKVTDLIGKTLTSIQGKKGDDLIVFRAGENKDSGVTEWHMQHDQDCCESVYVEDIIGNLNDLIGSPIKMAEEVKNVNRKPLADGDGEAYEWTFYKFATVKGYVTIRWYGTSNGYYSTEVSFRKK